MRLNISIKNVDDLLDNYDIKIMYIIMVYILYCVLSLVVKSTIFGSLAINFKKPNKFERVLLKCLLRASLFLSVVALDKITVVIPISNLRKHQDISIRMLADVLA